MRKFTTPPYALELATALLAIGNFALDTLTDVDSATAVLYVAVVLMSASFAEKRGIVSVGVACSALTLLSFLFTRGGSPQTALMNGIISISAIGITTYLVVRVKSAEIEGSETRAKLAHAARLTVLGELTASIAHEVNQPLAAIVMSSNACSRWLAADPPNVMKARQAIDRIEKDANRASDVIKRVRRLSTPDPPLKHEPLNINDVIVDAVSFVRRELKQQQITVRTQLADTIPLAWGDQIQLQQVLINLIVNAIEALSTVEVSGRELLLASAADGANIIVSVVDVGSGPSSGKLEQLFDTFYTTKQGGLGMGLAISRSIVESHGGAIWAKRNIPQGMIVEFTLPVVREKGHEPTRVK